MENLIGWLFLLIIFFFTFAWTKKIPHTKFFLITALLLRSLLLIFDQYDLVNLPDSGQDTKKFDRLAIEFSSNYGLMVVFDFLKGDSYLISRFISIFYTIFLPSEFMSRSLSVALGTASVYLVYQLCLLLWDHRSATRAAWVMAIFPSLILYSSLALREVYIVFFLLTGLIGIVKFLRNKTITLFLQIILSFFTLMFFHGPMILGVFIFLSYLLLSLVKKQLIKVDSLKIDIFSLFFIVASTTIVILFLTNLISIPYIGGFHALFNLDLLISKSNSAIIGNASYPSWLIINNNYEYFPKSIVKIFYFLYSPFIWDIKSIYQIIGLVDGMLYAILTIYLFRNWRTIWANPITRIFILIFIAYVIVYGLSVGNFGTGIRHRSKFVVILIILVAPKIQKFIFSTKKKLYKK